MFGHRVVLFQCEWYDTGSVKTMRVDAHCTSIDIRSRWYEDDSFVLPSQVQQVFYIPDTKLGDNWNIVEQIQRRGIWNVPESENLETNSVPNEVFQQETTTEVPPIVIEDSVVTSLRRNDIEPAIISEDVVLQFDTRRAQAEGAADDDTFMYDDGDELMGDFDDEDEEEDHSDFDIDIDIEP